MAASGAFASLFSGLTEDELLALVSATKKYPKVEGHQGHMNFAQKLSSLVFNEDRENKEMNVSHLHGWFRVLVCIKKYPKMVKNH